MVIYELSHLFYRYEEELVSDPKNLGLYHSYESIRSAIEYFSTQPGFSENQDAFSVRKRNVIGTVVDNTVYEVIVYFHSEDYEFEYDIELGLYGDEAMAQSKLIEYCSDNTALLAVQNLVIEKIINKCIIDRKCWPEGFTIETIA